MPIQGITLRVLIADFFVYILKKMTKTGHLWAEKYFALLIKIDVPMVFISFGGNCCVSSLALDPFSLTFYR